MKTDILGDRVKALEDIANEQRFVRGSFVLARVDGRSFHTFTKGMQKPMDQWLLGAMIAATVSVASDMKSRLAYVQSDEATFSWYHPPEANDELPFNGRVQKLCSLIAGTFSAAFLDALVKADCERYLALNRVPAFDCRVWPVPSYVEQREVFQWREKDAVKNAVSTAASTVATAKELVNLKHRERIDLLKARGFDWLALPQEYKHGAYIRRLTRVEPISAETLAKIPMSKRPAAGSLITRHAVAVDRNMITINQMYNDQAFFERGEEPKLISL